MYGASKFQEEVGYGYVDDNVEIVKTTKNGETKITKVKYFNDCLTYNIDGTAGFIFYREGRFSLSEKVRPLVILDDLKEFLDPIYLKCIIQPLLRENRKGREGHNGQNEFTKLSTTLLKSLEIKVPICAYGSFDLEAQKTIAEQYMIIEGIIKKLCNKIIDIAETEIILD